MSPPMITIGITAYNAQDTILDALNSALNQSLDIVQLIVVDDNSDDTTWGILEKSSILHPNVEIYQNAINRGVAFSRNVIIKHAKGEFIAFFDDDDISEPERVESQLTRLLDYEKDFADGAPVICHTARKQIYPGGMERIEPTMGCSLGKPAPSGEKVARRTLMGEALTDGYGSCATCSQMARTSTYRMLGGFDSAFKRCEDADLAIRLALAGGCFVGVREPLVVQKMTQTSDKTLDQLLYFWLLLMNKHKNIFDNDRLYTFSRKWIKLKFDWLTDQRIEFARKLMQLGLQYPLLTMHRLRMGVPSMVANRAFRRFYRKLA